MLLYKTRKSNPFHGFLNWLTPVYLLWVPAALNISPLKNTIVFLPYLRTPVLKFWLPIKIHSTWGSPSSGPLNLETPWYSPHNMGHLLALSLVPQANQGRNRLVMFCVFQDNTCDVPSVGQEILCCTLFVSHLQQAKPNFSLQLKPPYDPFSHLLIRGVYKVILEHGWMRLFCFI